MQIRILPGNIANMIAAGEVVQRPASVVKELVENSVDAGASSVTVIIQDAGRTLIQVIDNGCGMSADDAVVCFERHATSKLATAEDLDNILTFGFRGEALASIAAIAEVTLRTRRQEDELGCEVRFAGSHQESVEEVSTPAGCNFAVRNLFYNVPARRKYLKSDNVEFKHIVEEFTRVALTRPEIGFTLVHNNKDVFVLKPAKSLKYRVQDLMGSTVAGELFDLSTETSVVRISGFAGRPEAARKGLGNQFFFVNGRFFRSPYLHKAVMKAYEGLIPEGVTPSYFLYLDVAPYSIDVNISPTKTEIKFEEDSIVFQTLYACLKETLGKNSISDSIDFDRGDAPDIPVFGKSFEQFRQTREPSISTDSSYNPFDNDGFDSEVDTFNLPSRHVDRVESYGKLFEEKTLPSTPVLVVSDKYILTTAKSGVLAINIRRARERILYESFVEALSKSSHVTQTALFPETVQIGVADRLVFDENASLLASLGFDIRPFGNDTVVVNGVPEGFSAEPGKAGEMVFEILSILKEDKTALSSTMTATMADKFARLGVSGPQKLSSGLEAQRLIDTLFGCENSEYTASGRRTMTLIPLEDLDKKF